MDMIFISVNLYYLKVIIVTNLSNDWCHQLISHPEKIEKRAEKPLKIILL